MQAFAEQSLIEHPAQGIVSVKLKESITKLQTWTWLSPYSSFIFLIPTFKYIVHVKLPRNATILVTSRAT